MDSVFVLWFLNWFLEVSSGGTSEIMTSSRRGSHTEWYDVFHVCEFRSDWVIFDTSCSNEAPSSLISSTSCVSHTDVFQVFMCTCRLTCSRCSCVPADWRVPGAPGVPFCPSVCSVWGPPPAERTATPDWRSLPESHTPENTICKRVQVRSSIMCLTYYMHHCVYYLRCIILWYITVYSTSGVLYCGISLCILPQVYYIVVYQCVFYLRCIIL